MDNIFEKKYKLAIDICTLKEIEERSHKKDYCPPPQKKKNIPANSDFWIFIFVRYFILKYTRKKYESALFVGFFSFEKQGSKSGHLE